MPQRQQPRQQASCCGCCFSLVLSLSFSVFIFWLTLRVSVNSPVCSIEEFDAYALNKTANNATQAVNHTIHYDLKLKNKNKDKGIYYDALNVTFYYLPNASFPIGNATYPAFYQGYGKSTHRVASIIEPRGAFWESATAAVKSNGSALFRVELVTAVRYKNLLFKTKRHHVKVANELQVNDEGKLVKKKKKGIKLTSGSGKIKSCFNLLSFFIIILVFQHLW